MIDLLYNGETTLGSLQVQVPIYIQKMFMCYL